MNFSFESFVNGNFDYDRVTKTHSCIWLREEKMDIGGGKITIADIDRFKAYPDAEVVTISGLQQDTFEYFIKTYGKQLKAIRFLRRWTGNGPFPYPFCWRVLKNIRKYDIFYLRKAVEILWQINKY